MDVSGEPHSGCSAGDDMARWQAHVEAPLTYDYGRYTVQARPLGAGPGDAAAACPCSRVSLSTTRIR